MKLFLFLFTVAAVHALALPLSGPFQDHHFTERLPGHSHLYPGGPLIEHLHPYEISHPHGEAQDASDRLDITASEGGIIFLPPNEDGATGSSSLSVTAALLTMFIAMLIAPTLTQIFPTGQTTFRSIITALEAPPPRLAL